jgi:hypothetical protein
MKPFLLFCTLLAVSGCAPGSSSSSPAQESPPLSGFGASIAAWNKAHPSTNDAGQPATCCYGPLVNGHPKWASVAVVRGQVIAYVLALNPGPASAAKEAVKKEIPSDSVLVSDSVQRVCELVVYRSDSLDRVLRAAGVGQQDPGRIEVILTSANSNGAPLEQLSYDANLVDAASFGQNAPGRC